jgi:hypothetical protein
MHASDLMILSAIADRLIFGDPGTFRRDDTLELARLLPSGTGRGLLGGLMPSVAVKAVLPGSSAAGFAAGVGNITVNDEGVSFDVDSRGRWVVSAGQWKICRIGRSIEIEQVTADDADDGRTARVEFKRGGEPARMSLLGTAELTLGPLSFLIGRFHPWKTPADGD